MWLLLLFL
nr:Chain C, SpeB-inducing peptide (SIP) [Streptococcus pyogenes]